MNYVIIDSCCEKTRIISKKALKLYGTHSVLQSRIANLLQYTVNIGEERLCRSFQHTAYYSKSENLEKTCTAVLSSRKQLLLCNNIISSRNALSNSLKPGGIWCMKVRNISDAVANNGAFYEAFYNSSPVLFAQESLLYVHNISGLPWWATIILGTIMIRTSITLPLSLYQNYILAKVENLQLELKEISKEMGQETRIAVKQFKWTEKQAKAIYIHSMKKQWKKLIERDNCHPAKASILVLVQVPMWLSLSLGMRNLVYLLPVPDIAAQVTLLELSGGGILWFHNLALPDSTWIMPIFLGLSNLAIIELQNLSKVKESGKFQKFITNIFRGVSIIMVPIAASVPSCLCLYWTTSSVVGLVHNLILLSPRVRQLCRIPETASVPKQPYKHIFEKLSTRFSTPTSHPPSAT